MGQGLKAVGGNPASPPYRNGPYRWDQNLSCTAGLNGTMIGKAGIIYYVDEENGNDANSGNSPSTAFATILKATGLARDDYSDDAEYHIFIAPGSYDESEDLRLYGHGIHLHGMGNPGSDSGTNITDTNCTNAILLLAGGNCTVENIQFITTSATNSTLGAIYAIASDNCMINNCAFKNASGTGTSAILIESMRKSWIVNCVIGDIGAYAYVTGIYGNTGANMYLTDTLVQNNMICSRSASAQGIVLHADMNPLGTVIDYNWINLAYATGTTLGIHSGNVSYAPLVTNNYVAVLTTDTPISSGATNHGRLGNHTLAGVVCVDPNVVAG